MSDIIDRIDAAVDGLNAFIGRSARIYDSPRPEHYDVIQARDALTSARAEIARLEAMVAASPRFNEAPCPICGYNGAGYYQPETHPCAAMYHAAQAKRMHQTTTAEIESAAAAARSGGEGR